MDLAASPGVRPAIWSVPTRSRSTSPESLTRTFCSRSGSRKIVTCSRSPRPISRLSATPAVALLVVTFLSGNEAWPYPAQHRQLRHRKTLRLCLRFMAPSFRAKDVAPITVIFVEVGRLPRHSVKDGAQYGLRRQLPGCGAIAPVNRFFLRHSMPRHQQDCVALLFENDRIRNWQNRWSVQHDKVVFASPP